jgi:dTDP-4-amino-4,6-dideoxygalactose transaminase
LRTLQLAAAASVLLSGRTCALGGRHVAAAEAAVGRLLAVPPERVVGTATGTAALEAILLHEQVGAGMDVVLPAFGWVSVAAAIRRRNARPVLADVGRSLTVSLADLERASTERTRVWIVTHMRGFPVGDLPRIADAAARRGIVLVEDCAQAWGCRADDRPVGTLGAASFFSTQFNKLLSSGEGGFAVAARPATADGIRTLCGYQPDARQPVAAHQGNERMGELAAAVLRPQIPRLTSLVGTLVSTRDELADRLAAPVTAAGGWVPDEKDRVGSNGVTTPVWCSSVETARQVQRTLIEAGVMAYRPGDAGDMHQAQAWGLGGTGELPGLAALPRYVDIPTPRLPERRRHEWAERAAAAVAGVMA